MTPYIILQYPYDSIQIALCNNGKITQSIQEHKFNAIKLTIPHIQTLLSNHNLQVCDLAFIAACTGPGPYNTLRALLTMANGIRFAAQTPLIGFSALDLLGQEYGQNCLVMLNAFLDHVFYAFHIDGAIKQGACSIDELLIAIKEKNCKLLCMGNGAQQYEKKIKSRVGDLVIFSDKIPLFNSLEILAQKAFEKYEKQEFQVGYFKPIYFEDLKTEKQ